MIAKFSYWCPDGLSTPKAVVVLTPPSQSDGRGAVYDPAWQTFAVDHACALVGCYFRDEPRDTPKPDPTGLVEHYCDCQYEPEEGAGCNDAAQALSAFIGQTVPHGWYGPKALPLLLWGFSAGGQFNYEFACTFPTKVAAFVVNKGGVQFTALAPEATRAIPALWIYGEYDAAWRQDLLKGIFGLNKRAGAVWQLWPDPGVGHSVGQSDHIGRQFFADVLAKESCGRSESYR